MTLKISVKDVSTCEKLVTIDVPQDTVSEEYDAYFSAVAKRAKIPGFRPGHAPKHVIALHFKEQARQEVLRELLSRSYREAVRQKELLPISYPRIDQIEFDDKHLKFNAHIELRPQIKMDSYFGLHLKRNPSAVSDSEVEEVLKRIQDSHAKFEPIENRSAAMGDFVVSEFRLVVEGKEIEKRDQEWIEIREDEYLKGFSKQLIGVWAGENREVIVTFPADYSRKDLAGGEGHFFVNVKELKAKKLPQLDDDLAKETGSYQTFEELKAAVRRDLESHKLRETEIQLEKSLLDELVKRSKFEVPKGMVERRLQALLEEQAERWARVGMKEEQIKQKLDELKTEGRAEAERQVRISFILHEVAEREQIKTEAADLDAKYELMAREANRPPGEVRAYYKEHEEKSEALVLQILSEKVIQRIKDKAIIENLSETKQGGE